MSDNGQAAKKTLTIAASIMVGILVIFLISFTLRSFAKEITAPLDEKPVPIPSQGSSLSIAGRDIGSAVYDLKIRVLSNYIFVRASIITSGQSRVPAWFLLDSGTTTCLLTQDYAAQAGLEATGYTDLTSSSVFRVGTARIDGFAVATNHGPSLQTAQQNITIVDDDSVIQSIVGGQIIINQNYGGILGVPFFQEFNLLIDYNREKLLATRAPLRSIARPIDEVQLAFINTGGAKPHVTVPVSLNGIQAGHWILDLGSDSSLISREAAKKFNLQPGPPFRQLSLLDASITSASATVTVSLGPQLSTRQLVLDIPNAEIQALKGFGGDLATDYLRLLGRFGISFQDAKLYLFPN
jgi:hypothetical protein